MVSLEDIEEDLQEAYEQQPMGRDDLEEEVYDDEIDAAEEGFVRGYQEDTDDSFDEEDAQ